MKTGMAWAAAALLALPALGLAQEGSFTGNSKSARDTGIEIQDLIAKFAKRTGRKFIIDPRVRADVDLAGVDVGQLSYEQLLTILTVHQYAAAARGDTVIVVPDANARQLATPVYTDRNFKALDDEIVTLTVKGKNICTAMTVPVLRPLMPQAAHLAAEVQTNTLIINDHAANVRRIAELFDTLDRGAEKNPTSASDCMNRFETRPAPAPVPAK